MGKCSLGALAGAVGVVLAVGCGSAELGVSVGSELGDDDSERLESPRAVDGGQSVTDSGEADAEEDLDAARGEDARDSTAPLDAGSDTGPEPGPVDSGQDAGADAAPTPPTTFTMPAILKDESTCWQDVFPNPVCKPVPVTTPPIVEAKCVSAGIPMATLRIPPGSCVRIQGRFSSDRLSADACFTRTSCTAQDSICRIRRNDTDLDAFVNVHDTGCHAAPRFTAWWYSLDDCPAPNASCF